VSPTPDLAALELVAHDVATSWNLDPGPRFALSCWSFVAPVGDEAVLKVTAIDDDESADEGDALALWNGDGAVRLLRRDPLRRALLLERARPGTDISELPDDEATAIAVSVGARLWKPAQGPFRWIGDRVPRWLDRAEGPTDAARGVLARARELYATLEPGRSTLVHGDLHHHNILDAGGRQLAIDAKPMLGEPEFDVPSFLWNPLAYRMRLDVTERRLAAFAAAGLDEHRMRAWTVIRGSYLRGTDDHVVQVLGALL
jgi:streptomycin 6-kinase